MIMQGTPWAERLELNPVLYDTGAGAACLTHDDCAFFEDSKDAGSVLQCDTRARRAHGVGFPQREVVGMSVSSTPTR